MIDHQKLLVHFIEENQYNLSKIEPDLLELEQSGGKYDSEIVNRIFRTVHSVKGGSGFLGLTRIGELSHVMENVLSLLRDGKLIPSSELIDTLLLSVDKLKSMVDDVARSDSYEINTEIKKLIKFLNEKKPEEDVHVALKEKKKKKKEKDKQFQLSEDKVRKYAAGGFYIYSVYLNPKKDLIDKGITPYDFINNINILGEIIETSLKTDHIDGLSDCLDKTLSFNFLFASIIDPDLISSALDLPFEHIRVIDIDRFKNEFLKKAVDAIEQKKKKVSSVKEAVDQAETETPPMPPEDESDKSVEKAKLSEASPQYAADRPLSPGVIQAEKTEATIDPPEKARSITTEEKIRVGVGFLNELVNLAGELVLGRNQLMQISLPLVKNTPGLNPVLQHMSRVISEMQEKIMQMRMQPVSIIFNKFHRVVRDLARKLDKEVNLITYGEDVELDKTIIEALSDPLTHLIRNSVDHAVETPDVREKMGKQRAGTVTLRAYHQGGLVHLDIEDDGKGIDGDLVGKKAVEKELITWDQYNQMSEKEMVRLIFKPGFSTAGKVTAVSGRGVGMDVVITNIEQLGGTVDIETVLGKGTTIKLMLPLTLAIVSGLVICTGGQSFILPEANIDELVRVKPDEVKSRINVIQNSLVLRLRDKLLPLVNLKEVIGLESAGYGLNLVKKRQEEPVRILVLRHGATVFGLIVDSVENIEEIVVKPLPRYLKRMKCFSGASIMGNGEISLILDVAGIADKTRLSDLDIGEDKDLMHGDQVKTEEEVQTLLLFDNKTEERFALPLEIITRIERVPMSSIEKIRDKRFLQYQGEKLSLLFLEDYLPVMRPERSVDEMIGVIVPKLVKHPMGIVINRVIGTVNAHVALDTKTVVSPGLFGTAVLDGKITLLPDMYGLLEMAAPEWYEKKERDLREPKRKPRVLLAEDTPFFRMVEMDYLKSAGYEVTAAENGRKAMKLLNESSEPFDAVILDIIMPDMDGFAVVKEIRADSRLRRLPVMAVTSLWDEANAEKGMDAGFDEWETKLNKERLLQKLGRLLDSKKNS